MEENTERSCDEDVSSGGEGVDGDRQCLATNRWSKASNIRFGRSGSVALLSERSVPPVRRDQRKYGG